MKTQGFLSSIGATMRAEAAIEIIGVFCFGGDVDHGQRSARGGADDHVDAILDRQLAGVLDGRGGVGGVVEHDVAHLFTADRD